MKLLFSWIDVSQTYGLLDEYMYLLDVMQLIIFLLKVKHISDHLFAWLHSLNYIRPFTLVWGNSICDFHDFPPNHFRATIWPKTFLSVPNDSILNYIINMHVDPVQIKLEYLLPVQLIMCNSRYGKRLNCMCFLSI